MSPWNPWRLLVEHLDLRISHLKCSIVESVTPIFTLPKMIDETQYFHLFLVMKFSGEWLLFEIRFLLLRLGTWLELDALWNPVSIANIAQKGRSSFAKKVWRFHLIVQTKSLEGWPTEASQKPMSAKPNTYSICHLSRISQWQLHSYVLGLPSILHLSTGK